MSTHRCPGLCGARVPQCYFACPSCWYRLPEEYRLPINRACGRRNITAHAQAMAAAATWYHQQVEHRAPAQ